MESVIALRHHLSTVDFPAHVAVVPKPTGGASVGHQRFLWRMLTLLVVAIIAVVGAIAQTPGHTRGVTGAVSAAQTQLSTTARLAVSRALGGDLDEYQLTRFSGGFRARNSRQGLTANFGVHGATIATHDGARVSIALQAIGLGSALHPVAPARPVARANRVEYRRGGTTEWFANGPAGVEQGFTVASKPTGAKSGTLTLALGISGTLTARPGTDGGLMLVGADGKTVLRYGDLSVTDAHGRALPAHMAVEHGHVSISVNVRGARFPLRVDPLLGSLGELYASDGVKEDQLGSAIAAAGGTVVVGEPLDTVGGNVRAGSA